MGVELLPGVCGFSVIYRRMLEFVQVMDTLEYALIDPTVVKNSHQELYERVPLSFHRAALPLLRGQMLVK